MRVAPRVLKIFGGKAGEHNWGVKLIDSGGWSPERSGVTLVKLGAGGALALVSQRGLVKVGGL